MKKIVILYQNSTLGILLDDLFKNIDYGVSSGSKTLHVTKDINTQREVIKTLYNSYCDTRYVVAGKTKPDIEVVSFQDAINQLAVGCQRDLSNSLISKSYLDLLSDYKTIIVQDIDELLTQDNILPLLMHILHDENSSDEQSIVFTTKTNPYIIKNVIATLSGQGNIEVIDKYYGDILDTLYSAAENITNGQNRMEQSSMLVINDIKQIVDLSLQNNYTDNNSQRVSAEESNKFNAIYNHLYSNSCFICAPQSATNYLKDIKLALSKYHRSLKNIRSKEIDRLIGIVQNNISNRNEVNAFVHYMNSMRVNLTDGFAIANNVFTHTPEEVEILKSLLQARVGRVNLIDIMVTTWEFALDAIGEDNLSTFLSRFDHIYLQDFFYKNQLISEDKLVRLLSALKSLKPSIDIRLTTSQNDPEYRQRLAEIMQAIKDTANSYAIYSCAVSIPYMRTLMENKTPIERVILKQQIIKELETQYATLMNKIISEANNRIDNTQGNKTYLIDSLVASLIAMQSVEAYFTGKESINLAEALKQSKFTSSSSFINRYNITWNKEQIEFLNTLYNENMSLIENIQIASAVVGKAQNQYVINPYMIPEDILHKFQTYVQTYDLPCTFTLSPTSTIVSSEVGVGNLGR